MIKAWNRSELCLRLRLRRQLGLPASLGFQCLTPRWELLLLSSDMPDESRLSSSVLCNSLVTWLHLSNVKPEWGLIFGSQLPSLSLSGRCGKCAAASYSPDTLVTSNQYFQESKLSQQDWEKQPKSEMLQSLRISLQQRQRSVYHPPRGLRSV